MPALSFRVEGVEVPRHAAAPLLLIKLRLTNRRQERVHSVMLHCQLRIEPARRRYTPAEQDALEDLFGELPRWGQTLRPMLWTHAATVVPSFTGETTADLPVQCTYDFNLAATKYFHGLEDGDVPICLLFSGTIFYEGASGALQAAQIPWDQEASYRLPVRAWREMMDQHYPNTVWLGLRRDVFDRLYAYKRQQGLTSWEQALEALLPAEEAVTP